MVRMRIFPTSSCGINRGMRDCMTGRGRLSRIRSLTLVKRKTGVIYIIPDEFTFRLNDGNVARHTTRRLDSFVDATKGKRITYRRLIA